MRIWLVESREESNMETGARRGPWYPCGYEVHRKKKDAEVDETKLLCAAAGITVKTFEQSNVPRVENFVRIAAVAMAKRQLNLEKAARKW